MEPERDEMLEFGAAIKAAMESDDPEVELTAPNGARHRILKHPAPGVSARLEIVHANAPAMTSILWEPAGTRPEGFPEAIPFVALTPCATATIDSARKVWHQVQWTGVKDGDAVVEQIVQASLADGWEHARVQPSVPPSRRAVVLEWGTSRRAITLSAEDGTAIVTLSDTGPHAPGS